MYRKSILLCLFSTFGFAQSYDICIYGATSAGVIAAKSAKLNGKKVILIDPYAHIGGLSSGGLGQTDIGNKYAISGLSRQFYREIGSHYGRLEQWTFEPKVANKILISYLNQVDKVILNHQLQKVNKIGTQIKSISLLNTKTKKQANVSAKMFIDCTYEGDLMAASGVSFTVGRESNALYDETWNGVQLLDKHQFPDGVDPYKIPGKPESGLLKGIQIGKLAEIGSSDKKLQAYNFRMCLTDSIENRIPITKPENYNPENYEVLLRYIKIKNPAELNWALMHLQPMPNRKLDINNSGPFSTNLIGGNYAYPNATYAERDKIKRNHINHIKGFFYFLGHDSRVPEHLRNEMLKWGYPKDEFIESYNFSPQMYIREARRMVSDHVMTEKHCVGTETVSDGIGLAAYTMDSHNTQRIVVKDAYGKDQVKNEGDVQKGLGGLNPYPISYRSIVPKKSECTNLLVPVCLSASHIAFGSIRMEPVFMVLAQSAATAANMAIDSKKDIQEIDMASLQKSLKENPLGDSSVPELIIDNLDQNVSFTQEAQIIEKGYGRYGKNYHLVKSGKAVFSNITIENESEIYIYFPSLPEGCTQVLVEIEHNGNKVEKTLKIDTAINDWYYIGTLNVSNQKTTINLSSLETGKALVTDALLIKPKKQL